MFRRKKVKLNKSFGFCRRENGCDFGEYGKYFAAAIQVTDTSTHLNLLFGSSLNLTWPTLRNWNVELTGSMKAKTKNLIDQSFEFEQ